MKNALVVVDAWKYPPDGDLERYGQDLVNDTKTFSVFLNNVCNRERNSGTIIIHSSEHPQGKSKDLVDEIEIHPNDILNFDFNYMPEIIYKHKLTKLYFCGFHFGFRFCIQHRIKRLRYFINEIIGTGFHFNPLHLENLQEIEYGIALNLSMVLPGCNWNDQLDFSSLLNVPYYFWHPPRTQNEYINSNNFEQIFIKNYK